ncbi:MAG: DUF2304 domain-containing protein [Coriobacteriia bacterium]|nr:DUF2304 domain-containing protein [Coriobacteriia bacterium]
MSLPLQILLILGAVVALAVVVQRIRKRKILMEDAIFWVVFALVFVVIAVFPQVAYVTSELFGFVSPSNFIFLIIIVLLLWKVLQNSCEISLLKHRINELAQEIALKDAASTREDAGEDD